MFELNLMAELDEVVEEPPKPAERKRTFSASMRDNSRKSAGTLSVSPTIALNGARTSGIQIHNPQPLNTSGSVKKDLDPQIPPKNAPEQQPAQQAAVEQPVKTVHTPTANPSAARFSGTPRNSGNLQDNGAQPINTVTPEPRTKASTGKDQSPNPSAKANATPTPVVNNAQPNTSSKFAAITAAMQEAYNSVKAMKPSVTWQKCASDPYLGMQDTNKFAAAFCSVTGETFSIGDSHVNFPLSDIAWPLLFLMMREKMAAKVATAFKAKEPTAYVVGLPDRILQNPFYFPGAYTMCSWLTEMPVSRLKVSLTILY
jgi:hypothetical protein